MSTQELHEIRVIADRALAANTDQLLVSQRQYVDVLLDVRSVASSPALRETIEERLREIRFVSMLEASEIRADLEALVAIAEIEDELEMAWAEVALSCECDECAAALLSHHSRSVSAG